MANKEYDVLSPRSHVLKRPDVWIGSEIPRLQKIHIFNPETQKMTETKILLAPALERLYLEGISNAFNNAEEAFRSGLNPGSIDIWVDERSVRIKNRGHPIKMERTDKIAGKKIWIPELIFGYLYSSSNFKNEENSGVGRNGIGVKAINIMSVKFKVIVQDPIRKKKFIGLWTENMSHLEKTVEVCSSKLEAYTEIEYEADFERFGVKEYSPDIINLFYRHALDYSFTMKIPITFNNVDYNFSFFKDFISLYFNQEDCDKALFFSEWDPERNPLKDKTTSLKAVSCNPMKHSPIIEVCILDVPGTMLSYCNGMLTHDGGIHVKKCLAEFTRGIKTQISDLELKPSDISKRISMIISLRAMNPKYNSQEKKVLTFPDINPTFPNSLFVKIKNWSLLERIKEELRVKAIKEDNKNIKTKKNTRLILTKGEDCNYAGKKPELCTLYICEGESASSYPKKMAALKGGNKNTQGVYPLKGVPMNVDNFDFEKFLKNKEFQDLRSLLGLEFDTDYSLEHNFKKLRYHTVLFIGDPDVDGFHIISLLINMFNKYFPSLIEMGIIYYFRLFPIKVFKLKNKNNKIERTEYARYFTKRDYEDEAHLYTDTNKYYVKYFKGLASSDNEGIKNDILNVPYVRIINDSTGKEALRLAFDKKMSNARKEWISLKRDNYDPILDIISKKPFYMTQTITNYLDNSLMLFNLSNLYRALPSIYDGLKECQRKIIWGALNMWLIKSKKTDARVSQFSPFTAELTSYEHGEVSLSKAVIKMSQAFTGTNNLPYFSSESQTGDIDLGPSITPDPRYIYINIHHWVRFAFDLELLNLMESQVYDNCKIEPKWIPCAIPLGVVNGACGISTGFSCNIANHNPIEVIDYLIDKCHHSKTLNKLEPYYAKFKGNIITGNGIQEIILPGDIDNEQGEEIINTIQGKCFRTYGNYTVEYDTKKKCNVIIVSDLPIGRWFSVYRKFLEGLLKHDPPLISDFMDNSNVMTGKSYYKIYGFTGKINHENLGLVKSFPQKNMVLVDNEGYPHRIDNVEILMDKHYDNMINLYIKLSISVINKIKEKIKYISSEILFLELLENKTIIVENHQTLEILSKLDEYKIPHDIYFKMKISDRAKDKLDRKIESLKILNQELKLEKNKTPENRYLEKLVNLKEYLIESNWESY